MVSVELRFGVGDAAVVGERLVVERVADALDSRRVFGRRELGRLELRDRGVDRRLALRRIESLAFGRGEDEIEHGTLLRGELGLDQIGRALRVGARYLELVLQAAAHRHDERDQCDDDSQPGE